MEELVIDEQFMGTFYLCTDAPNGMVDGKLPVTGEHNTLDVIPHNEYGGTYRHVTKRIELGSLDKGPVILGKLNW